jgi:hypothetical protein
MLTTKTTGYAMILAGVVVIYLGYKRVK